MGMYDTLTQLACVQVIPKTDTFLYDLLVEEMPPLEDETATWDSYRGKKEIAPFIHEGAAPVIMGNQGYKTATMIFPTIAPATKVSEADIKKRAFGEVLYGGMTPEERSMKQMVRDLQRLSDSVQNTREMMAAQMLMTGGVEIFEYTDEGLCNAPTKVADFGFENLMTAANPWNASNGKIVSDIMAMTQKNAEGYGTGELLLVGKNVGDAFLENELFLKQLDNRRLDLANITQKTTPTPGVVWLGRTVNGVDIYCDSRSYVDYKGQMRYYIDEDKATLVSHKMFRCYHAPVTLVDKDGEDGNFRTYVAKEVPVRHASKTNNSIVQSLYTRPMIVPKNVSGWTIMDVV